MVQELELNNLLILVLVIVATLLSPKGSNLISSSLFLFPLEASSLTENECLTVVLRSALIIVCCQQ